MQESTKPVTTKAQLASFANHPVTMTVIGVVMLAVSGLFASQISDFADTSAVRSFQAPLQEYECTDEDSVRLYFRFAGKEKLLSSYLSGWRGLTCEKFAPISEQIGKPAVVQILDKEVVGLRIGNTSYFQAEQFLETRKQRWSNNAVFLLVLGLFSLAIAAFKFRKGRQATSPYA